MSAKPQKHVSCHRGLCAITWGISSRTGSHPLTLSLPLRVPPPSLPSSHHHLLFLQLSTLLFSFLSFHWSLSLLFCKCNGWFPASSLSYGFVLLSAGTVHLLQAHQKQNPGTLIHLLPPSKVHVPLLGFQSPQQSTLFSTCEQRTGKLGISPNQSKQCTTYTYIRTSRSLYSGHPSSPKVLLLPLQPYRTLLQAQHSA